MSKFGIVSLAAIMASAIAGPVFAADYVEPPVVEAPPQEQVSYADPEVGGWYIRGDVDYHWSDFRGADYILYGAPGELGTFDSGDLKGALSLGAGVGYQVNKYFRTDLTGDYLFKSDFRGSTSGFCGTGLPCVSDDRSSYTALLLLANAYADLGTYHGITPYIGLGIGGAHVKWDNLINTNDDGRFEHEGGKGWRFAYAAMAGASYCLTDRTKLDLGYRFSHIEGGRMFGYNTGAGPGYDRGINIHEVRGGLRYQFGNSDCAEPEPIAYEPPPVYKQ
jgi:opacity protein-like surface antigen